MRSDPKGFSEVSAPLTAEAQALGARTLRSVLFLFPPQARGRNFFFSVCSSSYIPVVFLHAHVHHVHVYLSQARRDLREARRWVASACRSAATATSHVLARVANSHNDEELLCQLVREEEVLHDGMCDEPPLQVV